MEYEQEHFVLEMNHDQAKRFHSFFSQLVKYKPIKKDREILLSYDVEKLSACYISNYDNKPVFITDTTNAAFFHHYLNRDNFIDAASETPYSLIITQSNFNSFFQNMEPLLKMKGHDNYILRTDNDDSKTTLHFFVKNASGSQGIDVIPREIIPIKNNDSICFLNYTGFNLKVFRPLIFQTNTSDDYFKITYHDDNDCPVLFFEKVKLDEEKSKTLAVKLMDSSKITLPQKDKIKEFSYKVDSDNITWLALHFERITKLPGTTITNFSLWENCIHISYQNKQENYIASAIELVIKGVNREKLPQN